MALPKEPRQKMINVMYLVLTALLALNVSSEILNAFKVVDASLVTSNDNLSKSNKILYQSLESKLKDPVTAAKAAPWNERAIQAQKLSNEMTSYLDELKLELKKESGLTMIEGKESYKEDNLDAATRLFGDGDNGKKKGTELESKLKKFKEDMLNIDPSIRKEFETTFAVDVAPIKSQDGTVKPFTESYFHMVPSTAAITLLSKFQNNIKNAENQVVTYCQAQVGAVKVVYDQFVPLVGQNSNYVMPGQEVEITAGVGAFSAAARPTVNINGSNAVLGPDGIARSKFVASGAGERTVPVRVTFTKPDGTTETKDIPVKYTVGTPGGAAVMLDKMNVFYIGVDNPVTIGSPTGWDKTQVTMSGGTISGTGSNRIVKVSALGKATINVIADKKPSTFEFRVKRIPDPVFKIGSGKARVPAVEFKNQQFCRADLENFDFDLKFNVVSSTVYFSGANFPNVTPFTLTGNNLSAMKSLMDRAGPGTSITFTAIKVAGPDGQRTIDERGITLY